MKMRDKPCEQCGWKYPGDHVCIDLRTPVDPTIQAKHNQRHISAITLEHRDRLTAGLTERWRRHREETAERDARIVQAYQNGSSFKELTKKFGPSFPTLRGILTRAGVAIRPRGNNVRWDDSQMENAYTDD